MFAMSFVERLARIAGRTDLKAPVAAPIRADNSVSNEQSSENLTPRYLTFEAHAIGAPATSVYG